MPSVASFAVTYDAECGLCTGVKEWMIRQVALVRLEFVPTGSPEARRRFPQLPAGELAVVSSAGDVWLGHHAWIVCLWALRDYRELAFRLTSPLLALMGREAFTLVSKNRSALSGILRLRSEHELQLQLREVAVPQCQPDRK